MFGFFKNLFRDQESSLPPVTKTAASTSVSQGVSRPVNGAAPAAATKPSPSYSNGNGNGHGHTNGKSNGNGNVNDIQLLLQPILDSLPTELRRKALHADLGGACVNLPVEKIMPQLARGIVKITFGELRTAAPGIFLPQTDRDQVEVVLPLAAILAHLNPALLVRRSKKAKIEVPDEVSSPFGKNGDGLIFAVGPGKVQPMPAPPSRVNMPMPTPVHNRSNFLPLTPPTPPAATPPSAPPVFLEAPVLRMANPPVAPSAPTPPPVVPMPAPMPMPAPVAEPAPITISAAEPAAASEVLTVPLAALAVGWPETVRSDIVRLNLMASKLNLPVDLIEPALKRGKVPIKWGTLRSWASPAPLLNMSVHDEVVVELPLEVLAPLFFERMRKNGNARRKTAIDETIPDLFFGLPQPESLSSGGSCAVTKPSDTNFINKPEELATVEPVAPAGDTNRYVWDDKSDTVQLEKIDTIPAPVVTKTPDTNFFAQAAVEAAPAVIAAPSQGLDFKRSATPRDIVTRAASLENVAGAFIALPDGLMVAGQIPPDLNGDTLAAFVPQIFSKVNQASNELRMGELNNVAFTVGNVPWKIFRVNAVFFAAFGRACEPMPTAQLAALAAELDQKNH